MDQMITVSREMLRQVLDAFETYAKQYPHMWKGYLIDAEQALRTALEQPAVEPVAWMDKYGVLYESVERALPTDTPLYAAPQAQQPAVEPYGHVTVRRLSQRFEYRTDQYTFYPAGQIPYLDNVDECHAVYTSPQPTTMKEPI